MMDEAQIEKAENHIRMKLAEYGCPSYMHESFVRYVIDGRPIGDFLTNLLGNDLMGAFSHADAANTEAMRAWTMAVYNVIPCTAWRSKKRVAMWVRFGGLKGDASQKIIEHERDAAKQWNAEQRVLQAARRKAHA